jgi:hypothetical protein
MKANCYTCKNAFIDGDPYEGIPNGLEECKHPEVFEFVEFILTTIHGLSKINEYLEDELPRKCGHYDPMFKACGCWVIDDGEETDEICPMGICR